MFIRKKRFNSIIKNSEKMQKHFNILLSDITQNYLGRPEENLYLGRTAQVNNILRKYKGNDTYGCPMLQRLINLRVAFAIPNRLFLVKNADTEGSPSKVKEVKKYLTEFLVLNGLNAAMPRDLAKEAEFEGQVLVRLVWNNDKKLPELHYYPRKTVAYKIIPDNKFSLTTKLKAEFNIDGKATSINDDELSYITFNDTLTEFEGYPTCGPILSLLENVDKDLRDWRALNHLFGHPTPHFKCDTQEEALAINDMVKSTGWKVGTAIATNSDFQLKSVAGTEGNLLMLSIQTGVKIISAHTGVSVHFLGFANIMSNRSTAETMGEPTEVVLHSEIASWKAFYTDLFNKAIRMRNAKLNKSLEENLIVPKLVPLTDRQWQHIKDVLMPAVKDGLISHDTFLSALPDIEADKELAKIEAEEDRARVRKEKFGKTNANDKDDDDDQEDDDDDDDDDDD